jgi:hypothetical protein
LFATQLELGLRDENGPGTSALSYGSKCVGRLYPSVAAMLRRLFLPALLAAKLATASDELTSVSQRENALADAVRSKNKALLSTLTDKDFHVSWNQGTAIRNLETDVSRQAWIDDLNHLRIKSYEIEISKVWRADKGERNQPPCRLFATPESTARLIIPLKLELGL